MHGPGAAGGPELQLELLCSEALYLSPRSLDAMAGEARLPHASCVWLGSVEKRCRALGGPRGGGPPVPQSSIECRQGAGGGDSPASPECACLGALGWPGQASHLEGGGCAEDSSVQTSEAASGSAPTSAPELGGCRRHLQARVTGSSAGFGSWRKCSLRLPGLLHSLPPSRL